MAQFEACCFMLVWKSSVKFLSALPIEILGSQKKKEKIEPIDCVFILTDVFEVVHIAALAVLMLALVTDP